MSKPLCWWTITLASFYVCLNSVAAYASYVSARNRSIQGSISSEPANRYAGKPPWEAIPADSKPLVLPPWTSAKDFLVTRQMPLSSGQREVLMISPSTKAEQRYLVNLPDTSLNKYELYEVSFRNIPAVDIDKLIGSKKPSISSQAKYSLRNFKVLFKKNSLSEIILADGSKAEFAKGQAVIKSPNGQLIETLKLAERSPSIDRATLSGSKQAINEGENKAKSSKQVPSISYGSNLISQGQPICQSNVSQSMNQAADSMARWQAPMTQSNTDVTQQIGWALAYGSQSITAGSVTGEAGLTDTVCRPPVQCGEKRVSGGSEVRTDLFDIPQGVSGSEVVLTYEFFDIPDSLEMYYNGDRTFSVGPTSASGTKSFKLPDTARQIGITLRGNNDPNTKWWYTISCTAITVANCAVAKSDEDVPSDLQEARRRACRLRDEFPGWKYGLDPCPCTSSEARKSSRFEESGWFNRWVVLPAYHPGAYTDFRSTQSATKDYISEKTGKVLRSGQQCTYDDKGRLITHGAAAGTPDAYSPSATWPLQGLVTENSHTYWDVTPSNAMTWQEYHQTWTPNNRNRCSANNVSVPPLPSQPPPVPGPSPSLPSNRFPPNNVSVPPLPSHPTPPPVPGPSPSVPSNRFSPNDRSVPSVPQG